MYSKLLPAYAIIFLAVLLPTSPAFPISNTPTLVAAQLTQIDITPAKAWLEVGDQQQFVAVGREEDGQIVQLEVVWAATGGQITAEGLYTATVEGCYEVIAIDLESGVVGKAQVDVECTPPEIARVVVSPSRIYLEIGDQMQFSAVGKNFSGENEDIHPAWTASGGAISPEGLFTAVEPGQFTVTASLPYTDILGTGRVFVKDPGSLGRWLAADMPGAWCLVTGALAGFIAGLGIYFWRRRTQAGMDRPKAEPMDTSVNGAASGIFHNLAT